MNKKVHELQQIIQRDLTEKDLQIKKKKSESGKLKAYR